MKKVGIYSCEQFVWKVAVKCDYVEGGGLLSGYYCVHFSTIACGIRANLKTASKWKPREKRACGWNTLKIGEDRAT